VERVDALLTSAGPTLTVVLRKFNPALFVTG